MSLDQDTLSAVLRVQVVDVKVSVGGCDQQPGQFLDPKGQENVCRGYNEGGSWAGLRPQPSATNKPLAPWARVLGAWLFPCILTECSTLRINSCL